jgi:hypothetical protein
LIQIIIELVMKASVKRAKQNIWRRNALLRLEMPTEGRDVAIGSVFAGETAKDSMLSFSESVIRKDCLAMLVRMWSHPPG